MLCRQNRIGWTALALAMALPLTLSGVDREPRGPGMVDGDPESRRRMIPQVTGRVLDPGGALKIEAPAYCGAISDFSFEVLSPVYNWQDNFIALTRLGNHWMPGFGDGDSMTAPLWHDQGRFLPFGSDGLRETWYISRDPLVNTAPFYRLLGNNNHMDSPVTSEGPHTLNLGVPHGYPWTINGPGLTPIRRYHNAGIDDTLTWLLNDTPPGYGVNATFWPTSATPRLGYQRFGNKIDLCDAKAKGYGVDQLDNPTFKIDFNRVWGGAIGKILYKPLNLQLVSDDIGDMVQSTLFRGTSVDEAGTCCVYNPTESGGTDVTNYGHTTRWAGSPILSASYSGTNPKSFIRTLKPLNFRHNSFRGNDHFSPLMWRGEFRKTTTLGHKIGRTVYEDVIRILFEAKLDAGAPAAMDGLYGMNNTFWLYMSPFGDGNINNFGLELFNVADGTSTSIPYPAGWGQDIILSNESNKAVIIANAPGTFAVGMFRPGMTWAHKILYWCSSTARPCPPGNQLFVVDYFNNHILSRTVWETEPVYFVAGAPAIVRQRMRQIAGF